MVKETSQILKFNRNVNEHSMLIKIHRLLHNFSQVTYDQRKYLVGKKKEINW